MKRSLLSFLLLGATISQAQVIINDKDDSNINLIADESAILDLRSENKGLLLPRPTQTPANPTEGLIFYDTVQKCFKGWDGTKWQVLGDACSTSSQTSYTISITNPSVVTEGANQEFTVTISPAVLTGETVTVDYITIESTATEDADYTADLGTLTFNASESSKTISISTIDDSEANEPDETYNILIDNAQVTGTSTASISNSTAIGTIQDNDTSAASEFLQDFDGTSTWNYTLSTPLCNNGGDTWDILPNIGSITMDGNFFAIQDLYGNCGSSTGETISFEEITITNQTTISFDYNIFEFDNGDDVKYTVYFDGVAQTEVVLINGNSNSSLVGTEVITIPAGTSKVSLDLFVTQNGAGDYSGFDNFTIK